MDLIEKYFNEREKVHFIKKPEGFISYKMSESVCLITNIYVLPEKRKMGIATLLEQNLMDLCVDLKIKQIHCQTDLNSENPILSMQAILSGGYIPYKAENNIIKYYKDL